MFDHSINIKDCLAAEVLLILQARAITGSSQSPPSDSGTALVRPEAHRPDTRNGLVPQSSGNMPRPSLNYTGSLAVNDNITRSLIQVHSPMMSQQVSPSSGSNRQQLNEHHQCHCSRCIPEESPRLSDLIYPPPADRRFMNLPSLSEVLPQHFAWHHHSRRPSRTFNTSQPVVPSQRQSRVAETQPYPQRQQRQQQIQQQKHQQQHQQQQQHHHVSLEAIKQYHSRKMKPQLKDKKKAKERMSPSSSRENNTSDDAELDAFFSSLRQHYRNEFEKEFKEQANSSDSSDSQETDESDDGSLYRPSSSEYVSNNNSKSMKKNKKRAVDTKNNSNTEKPRWTLEEKAELFEAVVRHKSLDIMATFDWGIIGADIGRLDKACKDQWRRGILKMFRDSIHKLDNV